MAKPTNSRRRATCLIILAASLWATNAQAQSCSDYPNGVMDGFAGDVAPSQLQIDRNCTIRNYPASNPLTTNFSFKTQPGQTDERWLIIFDNVVHTGNMSCNTVLNHKIWFTNGSSSKIQEGCQNLLIPVEKIDKQNPAGQTTASIGVPFTYTLTIPVLFDSATGTVINFSGSLNDVHGVIVWDDLNATGVDLTYLSHVAYWRDSGTPVPHTFSNVGGLLTFDISPIIPAGQQIEIEITVVLDVSPANVPGTQFINTAKWQFGRLIDGVFYQPLPGEWGISPPLTIAAPELVVTKSGPATLGRTLNLGEWGDFGIDVLNTGLSDAWNVTILDRLPDGATGGMCDIAPQVLSARVFAADGVTPVPGKGPLVEGTDFSLNYIGVPTCELTLTMLTAAATIGPNERLIITYRTRLDADSQDGAALTNVVGATRWFNGDSSNTDRITDTRTLTDGTVGVLDHEDAHTVTVALFGYFFEKTVANLTSGVSPTTTAAPGDTLRYTLRLQTTDGPLADFTFFDDLGELNASAVFVPGTLMLVPGTIPPGADTSNTDPNGGTNGAGILDIRGMNLPANSEVLIQFDITLDPTLIDGTVVTNQADLISGVKLADSDDPNVNGQADPSVAGDEDPTRVLIEAEPPPAPEKANTQATATIGEEFSYLITIPTVPHTAPLYDVRIFDDLTASAADLQFVDVTKISGSGSWTPVNTGTATSIVIEDPVNGIDIPAGEQIVIEITVLLLDTSTNVAGLTFTNTASYTYNLLDNNDTSVRPGGSGTTPPMTIVEPELTLEKGGPLQMRIGVPGTFTLDVHNTGGSPAHNLTITDILPNQADGNMCDAAPAAVTAQLFQADGTTPVAPPLTTGTDFAVTFNGDPVCTFTLSLLTAAAAIGPDERLIVTYQVSLDANAQQDATLTNIAGATEWFSVDVSVPNDQARTYTRTLTDGTVGVLDHEDAHTVVVFTPTLIFEKTAINVSSGEDPATVATPGDTLRYSLRIENAIDSPLSNFSIGDELDRLNAVPVFQAGTLNVITLPAGADASNTDPNGGAAGTGLLDVRNLSLGGIGDSLLIEFEVVLAPIIANGTYVTNQSEILRSGVAVLLSDDPNINGPADPNIDGDEDPTQILIVSAPAFDVDKISTYLDGDPNVLLAGERLRYTITVQNIGTDDALDVTLVDQIPANTNYVAGSTTLNGVSVPDLSGGVSPLTGGILLNAPEDPTPGTMHAVVAPSPDNIATIVFDVVVFPDAADGTVISNQAFVSSIAGDVFDQPSDDPRTSIVDDPTRDVVGSLPLIYAEKSAALQVDLGSPNIVDPGDTLRYTITIYNNGTIPATNVDLTDAVPANTTYVADSLTLNGLPVGQPDGGISPLIAGIPVSSTDLTPPLPGVGEGTLSPGESAIVQFDLRVDNGVATGTLISNQAVVGSQELPNVLTDGDGNPSTGPEPTVVVVGDGQQLAISKSVSVVNGGAALAGATLEYVVIVENIAAVPALYVVITDDLDMPVPGYLTYVDQSATMNGLTAGINVSGSILTADYASVYGDLQPGETIVFRFRAVIDPNLAVGTTITNTAVATWNLPPQTVSASVSIDVGGVVGSGTLNGSVWHDANFDNTQDGVERSLEGWTVELLRDGQLLRTALTAIDGSYRMSSLPPNDLTGEQYELRFSAPGAGAATALLGLADSAYTNDLQRIGDIIVASGSNLQNLNLPIDPNGVVYDAILRAPVTGATLVMVQAGSSIPLPAACFDDPAQQNQVTLTDGYYKFDLNFGDLACTSGGDYEILVTVPFSGYVAGVSALIPPTSGNTTAPFNVPACPGTMNDAIASTVAHCEVQTSEFAPSLAVPARSAGTVYHSHLTLDDSQAPGSSQLFNNHIPLDPILTGALAITKSTPMFNVTRGQLVPYVITASSVVGVELQDVTIIDRFPAGFRYVEGSARIDGVATEPVVNGRELSWPGITVAASGRQTLQLLLAVGAAVSEGEFVNRAQAFSTLTGNAMSEEASATVRLIPDPTFDCTDVTGKVFDDTNLNGYQDEGEAGIAGVRLVTARGLGAVTDNSGRFHITCAITPNESRGSNFILKLDDRTLPSGFRVSTRPVQVLRATRGKALRLNFGASIHRVVGLDLADAVFEPGRIEMRALWQPRIALLLKELQNGPAVLRLSYVADIEDEKLVERRLKSVQQEITDAWEDLNCCYDLIVEPEVFWRLGASPDVPDVRETDGR